MSYTTNTFNTSGTTNATRSTNTTGSTRVVTPNQRISIQLTVDPTLVGKLIGKSGSNIRRITSAVRAGCYIRAKNDVFTISAWTQQAVQKASEMLKKDQDSFRDPAKRPSKPFAIYPMDSRLVPHVVGRNGKGLRAIMNRVGDGCFIIHREGAFHISANSNSDLVFVENILRQTGEQFTQLGDDDCVELTTGVEPVTNTNIIGQLGEVVNFPALNGECKPLVSANQCWGELKSTKNTTTVSSTEHNNSLQHVHKVPPVVDPRRTLSQLPALNPTPSTRSRPARPSRSWADMADSDDSDDEGVVVSVN